MGSGAARCRDRRVVLADDGGGPVVDLRRSAGADVGDGDPPPRHGSGEAAGELGSALRPMTTHRGLRLRLFFLLISPVAVACNREAPSPAVQTQTQTTQPGTDSEAKKIEAMAVRFAPVDLSADVGALPANERQALAKLVAAAKVFDALFLRQVWDGNETLLLDLVRDNTALGRARLHYLAINKGPWSRLDHNEPFLPGVPPKPPQANFYPAGATKQDVEAWLKGLSGAARERA